MSVRSLILENQEAGPARHDYVQSVVNLATLYIRAGRYLEAEPMARQALDLHQKKLGKLHPRIALDLDLLGQILVHQGRLDEAETYFRRALSLQKNVIDSGHPHRIQVTQHYADLLKQLKRPAEARKLEQEIANPNGTAPK